jgi:hypothetical protein
MVDIKTIVDHETLGDHAVDPSAFGETANDWVPSAESLQLVDIICSMMAQQQAADARR